jgi:hypothetical protein
MEEEEENLFLQFVNAVKDDEDAQEELAVLRKWIYNTSTWTVPLEYIVCR